MNILLRYLSSKAFEFFHEDFTENGSLTDARKAYKNVNLALLNRFSKVEDAQDTIREVMENRLLALELSRSLQKLDRFYARAEFNKQARYGLLRAAITIFQELAFFAIYRDASDYKTLKKAVEDFWSGHIAIRREKNAGNREGFAQETLNTTWDQPEKIHYRNTNPDSYFAQLETEVKALAKQLADLSLLINKNQKESLQGSKRPQKVCSYCQKSGHGAS